MKKLLVLMLLLVGCSEPFKRKFKTGAVVTNGNCIGIVGDYLREEMYLGNVMCVLTSRYTSCHKGKFTPQDDYSILSKKDINGYIEKYRNCAKGL